MNDKPKGRIEAQGLGIGAVSDELLQQRARDLAEQDGRTVPTDADRARALEELITEAATPAPEIPPGDQDLISWNESPDTAGHAVPVFPPDDEAEVSAELTEEGVDEADQDRRRAAKDENPPQRD